MARQPVCALNTTDLDTLCLADRHHDSDEEILFNYGQHVMMFFGLSTDSC